jgi:hypothetical protein
LASYKNNQGFKKIEGKSNTFLTFSFQGSRDNMSVILICFPSAPKVSAEAVKKEAELDKYLESRVEGGSLTKINK